MSNLEFTKMHGLGNDFVVFDGRVNNPALSTAAVRAISNRFTGVGCDQLIVLEPSETADVFMRIYNADGGESGACGNATRCIGAQLMDESGNTAADIETVAGLLKTERASGGRVSVDMGPVYTEWQDIPLAQETDTLHLPIEVNGMRDPVAVSVGNPHMVFFVDDASVSPIDELGYQLERHPLFPERTNVQMAEILGYDRIQLKTWERGVGRTLASGSSACAALAAAHRRGLCGRHADVLADGGTLSITWRDDNHVVQTGPYAVSYHGRVNPAALVEETLE